jgi:hypothetical protein
VGAGLCDLQAVADAEVEAAYCAASSDFKSLQRPPGLPVAVVVEELERRAEGQLPAGIAPRMPSQIVLSAGGAEIKINGGGVEVSGPFIKVSGGTVTSPATS